MAVMGRKKQMIANLIKNREIKEKEVSNKERIKMKEMETEVTEEEHQRRLKLLRDAGIIK